MDSQESPWLRLGESHHFPLYIILFDSPQGLHPNDIFFKTPKSQVEGLAIFEIGIPDILDTHNFLFRPLIKVRSKEKL
jgi:hypothetical protein